MNIRDILLDLGLQITEMGGNFRAKPPYRDSNNPTSLIVHPESGNWFDFGTSEKGNFLQLVAKIKGISEKDSEKLIKDSGVSIQVAQHKEKAKTRKTFSEDEVILEQKHNYWINRGISVNTLQEFRGGLCQSGKLQGRYVFPIFSSSKKIVGYAGRSIATNPIIKWKIIGEKKNWCYPVWLNQKDILDKNEVILVESIGDLLSLFEVGIRNAICLFGVAISPYLVTCLLKLNPSKIIIALNMDSEENAFAGEVGAQKVYDKLSRHFDSDQIIVKYPKLKDFNEMLLDNKQSILEWYGE